MLRKTQMDAPVKEMSLPGPARSLAAGHAVEMLPRGRWGSDIEGQSMAGLPPESSPGSIPESTQQPGSTPRAASDATHQESEENERARASRVTMPFAAVSADHTGDANQDEHADYAGHAHRAGTQGVNAEDDEDFDPDFDPGATVATAAVPSSSPASTSRPRKNTLAAAMRRRQSDEHSAIPAYHPDSDELPGGFADDVHNGGEDILDETDREDEWSVADQPTVMLIPQTPATGGVLSQPAATERASRLSLQDAEVSAQEAAGPRQPKLTQPIQPDVLGGPRYASPEGKLMPVTPPEGVPRAPSVNPRVERFQELRGRRKAREHGQRDPQDSPPVDEMVRSWWSDLTPGLEQALQVQHEARASGAYPIPAYVATAVSRLGDVFGKVAVSTRELATRAHDTAAPTLRRWHDQAEEYAQRLIDKLDGGPVQQQAPFLGPGRIAVLFRSGVTVGQAQRLLQSARARPLRLIPRKHGFLALVPRGLESEVAERLKQHPYVRDVIYMEYDDPSQSLSAEVPAMIALQR